MRIAVVGAGAIGGYLGGWLAAAGEDVTFIARGANLSALCAGGMRVVGEDGAETIARNVRAFEHMRDAGVQDAVLLTVKAHQVANVAGELHHLCDADTAIVTMQNGIPWWYFHNHGGPFDRQAVRSADPDGSIGRAIDPARIIGSVVYPAAVLEAPGHVHVVEGRRFSLGELNGESTERVQRIAAAFVRAGFKAPVIGDIRSEIWLKIWGNLSFNPISALTHATLVDLLQYPLTRELSVAMMREAQAVAERLGVTFRVGIDKRIAGAEKVGAHKTSMLQDVEAGRALEIEALIGAVIELGRLTEIPTPHIDAVYACVSLLNKTLADSHGRLSVASLRSS
jgi:2-dehydropantoate 2-reductase